MDVIQPPPGAAAGGRACGRDRQAPLPACRCCGAPLTETFADLGMTPLANSFIPPDQTARMEPFYPLRALVCSSCRLVQLAEFADPQAIFSHYPSCSWISEACLRQAEAYAEAMAARLSLCPQTPVVAVASNDGYLL